MPDAATVGIFWNILKFIKEARTPMTESREKTSSRARRDKSSRYGMACRGDGEIRVDVYLIERCITLRVNGTANIFICLLLVTPQYLKKKLSQTPIILRGIQKAHRVGYFGSGSEGPELEG